MAFRLDKPLVSSHKPNLFPPPLYWSFFCSVLSPYLANDDVVDDDDDSDHS